MTRRLSLPPCVSPFDVDLQPFVQTMSLFSPPHSQPPFSHPYPHHLPRKMHRSSPAAAATSSTSSSTSRRNHRDSSSSSSSRGGRVEATTPSSTTRGRKRVKADYGIQRVSSVSILLKRERSAREATELSGGDVQEGRVQQRTSSSSRKS